MVFDASSKTPGGNSLNGVLAKGQNRLCKLQHLLVRFRRGKAAVTADISMAYNGTKLRPEHLKYQKYLWKDGLLEANPTKVMYVTTLIYGVKPSGQQTQVSLEKLAAYFRKQHRLLEGALVLETDTYVDDIINSQDSQQDCMAVSAEIVEILARGSMSVKAFTFRETSLTRKCLRTGRMLASPATCGPQKPIRSSSTSGLLDLERLSEVGGRTRSLETIRRRCGPPSRNEF
jgi:hypothetical protein